MSGLVSQETSRLRAWNDNQALSGLVQLWVTVSKVGVSEGRICSMSCWRIALRSG